MIYELNEEKSNQIVHCWISGTFIIKFVTATYKELKKGMTFQHFPIQIYDENQWKTTDFGKEASNLDVNILVMEHTLDAVKGLQSTSAINQKFYIH